MKIRNSVIAIAAASLLVIPAGSAVAGGSYDDCRYDQRSFEHSYGGKNHKDYKYAPDKECDKKDKDHRDKGRDRDKVRDRDKAPAPVVQKTTSPSTAPASKAGRVLKTG